MSSLDVKAWLGLFFLALAMGLLVFVPAGTVLLLARLGLSGGVLRRVARAHALCDETRPGAAAASFVRRTHSRKNADRKAHHVPCLDRVRRSDRCAGVWITALAGRLVPTLRRDQRRYFDCGRLLDCLPGVSRELVRLGDDPGCRGSAGHLRPVPTPSFATRNMPVAFSIFSGYRSRSAPGGDFWCSRAWCRCSSGGCCDEERLLARDLPGYAEYQSRRCRRV